jgi:transcriptional regulator with XRE-family HTH domain
VAGQEASDVEGALQQALGRNLRAQRTRMGLSQEAMAEHLHVHRTYIGGLERGERNVTLQTVERFSASLGMHPLDLLWDRERVAVLIDATGGLRIRDVEPSIEGAAAADGPTAAAPPAARRRHKPRSP